MADSRIAYSADDIRERTNIVEVIAPHVSLRKQGKRLVGLCPFHTDKAPSFSVDPDKGLWHCFGCGAGGNVFHFLMRVENLTFPDAASKLAQRLGVEFSGRREPDHVRSARDRLERVNAEAAAFFRGALERAPQARRYLAERRLTDDISAAFGIGWAPAEWDNLYRHLRRQGYGDDDIGQSGLCVARPRGDGYYDRFRGRVMFPIRDAEDRVIGFGGRLLEGAVGGAAAGPAGEPSAPAAKYINSPETPLFRKGRTLYAFPAARKAMGERGRAIIVEGYIDAIACHAAGFTETVATLGTALTAEHLEVLRRHTDRVYAAFDSDSAGMKAVLRSHELFANARLEVRVVRLPEGHDPDTFLAESGPEGLTREIESALTVVDYRLAIIAASHPDTDDGRLAVMREALEVLATVGDAMARAHYVHRLAERCCRPNLERVRWMEQAMHQELRKRHGVAGGAAATAGRRPADASGAVRVERQVLAAMLQSDVATQLALQQLSSEHFGQDLHRALFQRLRDQAATGARADVAAMLAEEQDAEVCALLSDLTLGHDEPAADNELRQAIERMCEWHDARRCRELLQRAEAGEITADELSELTQLRRHGSAVTARRSVGDISN